MIEIYEVISSKALDTQVSLKPCHGGGVGGLILGSYFCRYCI